VLTRIGGSDRERGAADGVLGDDIVVFAHDVLHPGIEGCSVQLHRSARMVDA
jgi:hypothetical protein